MLHETHFPVSNALLKQWRREEANVPYRNYGQIVQLKRRVQEMSLSPTFAYEVSDVYRGVVQNFAFLYSAAEALLEQAQVGWCICLVCKTGNINIF